MYKPIIIQPSTPQDIAQGSCGYDLFFRIMSGDTSNPVPLDITGATIKTYFVLKEDRTIKFSGDMTIVDPLLGQVKYTTSSLDFPDPGTYECEIEVIYSPSHKLIGQGIQITCKPSIIPLFEGE